MHWRKTSLLGFVAVHYVFGCAVKNLTKTTIKVSNIIESRRIGHVGITGFYITGFLQQQLRLGKM